MLAIAPSLTYEEMHQCICRITGTLHGAGFKKGDSITLSATANWRTICTLFAAWHLSLIVTLVDPRFPNPSFLDGDPLEIYPGRLETWNLGCAKAPRLNDRKSVNIRNMNRLAIVQPRELSRQSKSKFQADRGITNLDLDAPALRLATSGSSGQPKWAHFTLRQLFASARTVAQALGAQPQDRWLLSLPIHHVGGLGIVLRALLTHGTLVIDDKSLPYPDRLINAQAQFASLVPTQLYRLVKSNCPPLSTRLIIGGAPMAQSLYTEALSRGLSLTLTYGLTEMSSSVLLTDQPHWPYLGFPLPGCEMKLVNREIFVRGISLFSGYGEAIDDWFATGDIGMFHPLHGFAICGRKDFQFTCGGENIQPEEIETIILSWGSIEQAIIVPQSDEEYGARPVAFIEPFIPSEHLIAFLAHRLAKAKIPIAFFPLPKSLGLKPSRYDLIKLLTLN